MVNHVYVAMFGTIPEHPTGLAVSVLRRAQAFAAKGIATRILIDTFSPDFDYHAAALRANGMLPELVQLRNMYSDLAGQEEYPPGVAYQDPLGTDGWKYVQDEARPSVRRGRENGVYKQFVWTRERGRVHFIDHLQNDKRVRREWHDEAGLVCRVDIMNADNKPAVMRYLDRQGYCYLEDIMDEASGAVRGVVLNRRDDVSLFFRTRIELFRYWMQEFVLRNDPDPTIISEYGLRREALQSLVEHNNARVIYTVHNNHFPAPYTYGDIRPDMADFFAHIGDYTDVVLLTQEQRTDLWKAFGVLPSLHVIPHHMPPSAGVGPRDSRKIVVVGRFAKMKGQLDALYAFSEVIKAVPDAHIEFYGRGEDEEKIRSEIERLGLTKSARIMGFTDNSHQVFSEAAVSVVASDYEGYCLSLAESMAAGCVPVSYDIKYGPRELIRNGIDGLLVQHGNVRELGDAIKLLLVGQDVRQRMSESATAISERLSEARFMDEWLALLGR